MRTILVAILVLFASSVSSQNISGLSDDELTAQEIPAPLDANYVKALWRGFEEIHLIEYQVVDELAIADGHIIIGSHIEIQEMSALLAVELLKTAAKALDDDELSNIAIETKEMIVDPDVEAALNSNTRVWPNRRIGYKLTDVDPDLHDDIELAILSWNQNTNIEFFPASGTQGSLVFRDANGDGWNCSAHLGYIKNKGGYINLNPICPYGTIVHEIGHALGLMHEHSRPERSRFLDIRKYAGGNRNFDITPHSLTAKTEYDVCSVMHYSPRQSPDKDGEWFSLTQFGKASLRKCRENLPARPVCRKVGQRCGLSAGDIALINQLYPKE